MMETLVKLGKDPYASRTGDSWSKSPRATPVVHHQNSYPCDGPLTREQIDFYRENGFIALPEYFGESDLLRFSDEGHALAANLDEHDRRLVREPEGNAIRSIFAVQKLSNLYRNVCRSYKLAGIARQILGSDVYIHQSRLNFKPGFVGKEFFWHSDFETWHTEDGMPEMRATSCFIALTENFEHNGPLLVIPGSHKTYIHCPGETPDNHFEASLRRQELGTPPAAVLEEMARKFGIHAIKGKPGLTVFFDCNLLHGSATNMTPFPRHNLFFVYNSVENSLGDPYCGKPPRPEFIAHREAEALEIV